MGQARKKYTQEYKDEAVELVISSGRPMAEIARDLGTNEGTLGNWVNTARKSGKLKDKPLDTDERAELRELARLSSICCRASVVSGGSPMSPRRPRMARVSARSAGVMWGSACWIGAWGAVDAA